MNLLKYQFRYLILSRKIKLLHTTIARLESHYPEVALGLTPNLRNAENELQTLLLDWKVAKKKKYQIEFAMGD